MALLRRNKILSETFCSIQGGCGYLLSVNR